MEVTKELYEKIRGQGIILDHLFLMYLIREKQEIPEGLKGYIFLLQKKEYLINNILTQKALDLLNGMKTEEIKKPEVSFSDFCNSLFEDIKTKITELHPEKKDQWKNPSKEYLRPSSVKELQEQLEKFVRKYNYTNLERIREEILKHVEYAINTNKTSVRDRYVRSIYYFIMKKDIPSELLKKLQNYEEEKTDLIMSVDI